MGTNSLVYLDERKTFYDPCPGSSQTTRLLPATLKQVANDLNGKELTVLEALEKLKAAANGGIKMRHRCHKISVEKNRNIFHIIKHT